jgi:hypothetical protein
VAVVAAVTVMVMVEGEQKTVATPITLRGSPPIPP